MDIKQLTPTTHMPMVGLGTSTLRGDVCVRAAESALELGYRHIDTAEMYDNEEAVGAAIASSNVNRQDIFITSKVWRRRPLQRTDVLESCAASLERLRTDYVDLYLIHWPMQGTVYAEVFQALGELQEQGRIKTLGVSNFTSAHLRESLDICGELGIEISVNQVEFHPGLYQQELLEFCTEHGMTLTAYSPVAKGDLKGSELLTSIGEKYSKSAHQIALRWLVQKGIVVVPRSSQTAHQQANLKIFDFELSEEESAQIDALGSSQRLVVPEWAEFDYTGQR